MAGRSWLGGASCLAERSWQGGRAEGTESSKHGGESLLGEGSWSGRGSLQEGESLLDRDSWPGEGSWPEKESLLSLLGERSCPGGGSWPGEGSLLCGGSSAPGPFLSSKGISFFSSASDSNIWKTKRKQKSFRRGGYEMLSTVYQPTSQRLKQNQAVARTQILHPAPHSLKTEAPQGNLKAPLALLYKRSEPYLLA